MTTSLRRVLVLATLAVALEHPAAAQTIEVTPFVGFETAGSYPLENPGAVQALRAEAGATHGLFVDYRLMQNVQAEFYWVSNATTYTQQSAATGDYGQPFSTHINQYQFGALYHLRDRDYALRPYIAGSLGFTHDSNDGAMADRTALSFGIGGGVKYEASRHVGFRGDARWLPTYGSSSPATFCDYEYYGGCYQDTTGNYLQRFTMTIGLIIRP